MELKNVVIWATSNFNWLWVPLAEEIKRNYGAKIHFIASIPESAAYWKKQDKDKVVDSYTTICNFFHEYDTVPGSPEEVFDAARQYEEKYNILVVDALQTDRHLGRGYSAAGPGHPRSELSDKADYIKSVNMFNRVFKFMEDYCDRVKPDLFLGAFSSGIVGKVSAVVARCRNIPMRSLINSPYMNYFYWGVDEHHSNPAIKQRFEYADGASLKGNIFPTGRIPLTDKHYGDVRRYKSMAFYLSMITKHAAQYYYRKLRGVKGVANYKLLEDIKYLYRLHREVKAIEGRRYIDMKELLKLDYVFFALHTEPEFTLTTFNPEFNEQLALIELVAKNLPAGVFLVVKEHLGAIGRRPTEFYSTLEDIPNVLIASPYASALEITRNAKCAITITGSAGAEAAILGVPVVSFGLHNNFNFLPHVHVIKSWMELRPILTKYSKEDTQEARNKRQADGRQYLAAMIDVSIDLHFSNYASKKRERANERELEVLYSSLIKSIETPIKTGETCLI